MMSAARQRAADEHSDQQPGVVGLEDDATYVERARRLLYRHKHAEAIRVLRAGLAAHPDDDGALLLGQALVLVSRFREARTVLELLIAGTPNAAAYALMVRVCLALQDVSAALKQARRGVERFPSDADLHELALQAEADYEHAYGDDLGYATDLDATAGRGRLLFGDDERAPAVAVLRDEPALAAGAGADARREFDAPTDPASDPGGQAYGPLLGPGAPNLESAVQRFIRAAHPARADASEDPMNDEGSRGPFPADHGRRRGLLSSLLGDGPPLSIPATSNDVNDANDAKDVEDAKDAKDVDDVKDAEDAKDAKDVNDVDDVNDVEDAATTEISAPPVPLEASEPEAQIFADEELVDVFGGAEEPEPVAAQGSWLESLRRAVGESPDARSVDANAQADGVEGGVDQGTHSVDQGTQGVDQEDQITPFVPASDSLLAALDAAAQDAPIALSPTEERTRTTLGYDERRPTFGAKAGGREERRSREIELEQNEAVTRATLRVDGEPSRELHEPLDDVTPRVDASGLDEVAEAFATPPIRGRREPSTGPQPRPDAATRAQLPTYDTGPRRLEELPWRAGDDLEDDEELSFVRANEGLGVEPPHLMGRVDRRERAASTPLLTRRPTPSEVARPPLDTDRAAFLADLGDLSEPSVDDERDDGGSDDSTPDLAALARTAGCEPTRREYPTRELRRHRGAEVAPGAPTPSELALPPSWPADEPSRVTERPPVPAAAGASLAIAPPPWSTSSRAPAGERADVDRPEPASLLGAPTPSRVECAPYGLRRGVTADFPASLAARRAPTADVPALGAQSLDAAALRARPAGGLVSSSTSSSSAIAALSQSPPPHASHRRAQRCPPRSMPQNVRRPRMAHGFGDDIGSAAQRPARSRRGGEAAEDVASVSSTSALHDAMTSPPRSEEEQGLVAIAPVKVSRPDKPTANGYRLGFDEAPLVDGPPRELDDPRAMPGVVEQRVIPERLPASPFRRRPQTAGTARLRGSWARRSWAAILVLALALAAGGAVGGLYVRKRHDAAQHLAEARALAKRDQAWTLRSSLEHARQAATLGGRSAVVVALAARIHARLAFEFGESSLGGVASLVEESKRLGAPYKAKARADLAVAEAYLKLAKGPLPQVQTYLAQACKRVGDERELILLSAVAAMRAGRHDHAAKLLDRLGAHSARVVRTKAQLAWHRGRRSAARKLLAQAASYGLSLQQVDLDLARFAVWERVADDRLLQRLRALAGDKDLSRAERSWAQLLSAAIHRRQGRLVSAQRALERSLAKQPVADPDFHALAARELLAANQQKRARREALRARSLAPQDRSYRRILAQVELALDRSGRAVELLRESTDAADRLLLIHAYLRRGKLTQARAIWAKLPSTAGPTRQRVTARLLLAEGKPYQVLRELSSLPAKQRDHAEVEVLRARAALAVGELSQAERFVRHALALHPRHAEGLWTQGLLAEKRGEAAAARIAYAEAVRENGSRVRARLDYARLLARLGDHVGAEAQAAAVLQQQPQDPIALVLRARARVELQQKDALTDLRTLREQGQKDVAKLLGARVAMLAERWRQAHQLFESLPERWISSDANAQLWRAAVYAKVDRVEDAREIYRELLGKRIVTIGRGAQATAQLEMSRLAFAAGRLALAMRFAREAVETLIGGSIYPRSLQVEARFAIARCHQAKGRFGAAIAELQEALELEPASYQANVALAKVYLKLKKRARAASYLDRARKARPADKAARALLAKACRGLAPLPPACR